MSKRPWKRDVITGLPLSKMDAAPEIVFTDCSSPLWDPTSIAAATCLTQGLAKESVPKSRIMWRLRGDPNSPLICFLDEDGKEEACVADEGKLNAWGEKNRTLRQQNQKRGKKLKP